MKIFEETIKNTWMRSTSTHLQKDHVRTQFLSATVFLYSEKYLVMHSLFKEAELSLTQ